MAALGIVLTSRSVLRSRVWEAILNWSGMAGMLLVGSILSVEEEEEEEEEDAGEDVEDERVSDG